MEFIYGKQDFKTLERGEENCYLMTNGLGGFSSLTMVGSCSRNDHAVLMSCEKQEAPNHRYNLIHRLEETLLFGEEEVTLSAQRFTDKKAEEGNRYLSSFTYEHYPQWTYQVKGVTVTKKLCMLPGKNQVGITWFVENRCGREVILRVRPWLQFVPKGTALSDEQPFEAMCYYNGYPYPNGGLFRSNGRSLYCSTSGVLMILKKEYHDNLYYAYDACDGRAESGAAVVNHQLVFNTLPGEDRECVAVYGTEEMELTAEEMEIVLVTCRRVLVKQAGLQNEAAQALVLAANQFISYRASTKEQTILAGFPFFEDWGRDTMIALTGCCLSIGQYKLAESILKTFMAYCRKGLMPNLFPEGAQEPRYNTVDAALLFIIAVYEYYRRTDNKAFLEKAYPVMEEIISSYIEGTDFAIGMDEDGLISAGEGYDQVTWMDVRVGDILPTPRHGKPVEVNAYWYNALCMMEFFREICGESAASDVRDYKKMAEKTKKSFQEKFWNEKKGCLRDVLSSEESEKTGAAAPGAVGSVCPDEQLRCNQIWAVSLPFSVLEREQERQVVEVVSQKLYTPLGLRSLEPEDAQFKPFYGGELLQRDLAYHQGTVWTFPLGAYYLAYLKVNDYEEEARESVSRQLQATLAALREGCIGQLPEIYDGLEPASSKGCFAQAWSVGELLRVYEALEKGGIPEAANPRQADILQSGLPF